MKYILIGCGRIGDRHIKAAIKNKYNIVGLCDVKRERIASFIDKFSLKSVVGMIDYKELNERVNPDVVAIATPSGSHSEIAEYFLKKGKKVILEKPMAMGSREAKQLLNISDGNLLICHQKQYNSAVQKVKELLENNVLGKIYYMSGKLAWHRDESYYNESAWRGTWESDGGALLNQGVHLLEIICSFANSPLKKAKGNVRNLTHHYIDVEDSAVAELVFYNNIVASIDCSLCAYKNNFEESITLFCENGTIKIGGKALNEIEYINLCNEEIISGRKNNNEDIYGAGHEKLYARLKENTEKNIKEELPTSAYEAIKAVMAIYASAIGEDMIGSEDFDFSAIKMKEHNIKLLR